MRSPLLRALLLLVPLAIAASGCSSNNETVTTPTPTVPVLVTDTFAGAISAGGVNYHLLSAQKGEVTTTMTGIGLDPNVTIGMSIGVYSLVSCTIVLDNPSATIGTQLKGTATAANSLCVKVYDAGTVTGTNTLSYELTVAHY